MSQAPIMHIGTTMDAQSAQAITNSIVKIMESRADQKTIRAGLIAFAQTIKIEHISIQNCNITGDKTTEIFISSDGVVSTPESFGSGSGIKVE